jgi:CheY-like chemotaxis protein
MKDDKLAKPTTLLLVDDDVELLEVYAVALKIYGFSVVTASSPVDALTIMEQRAVDSIETAVVDYHMPMMNGCVLADYLRARHPGLKIILHSGVLEIPEREMSSIDAFVPKGEGIRPLLAQIFELEQDGTSPGGRVHGLEAYDGSGPEAA